MNISATANIQCIYGEFFPRSIPLDVSKIPVFNTKSPILITMKLVPS